MLSIFGISKQNHGAQNSTVTANNSQSTSQLRGSEQIGCTFSHEQILPVAIGPDSEASYLFVINPLN